MMRWKHNRRCDRPVLPVTCDVLDLPQCAKFQKHTDEQEEGAATFVSVLLNGVKAPAQLLIWDDLR